MSDTTIVKMTEQGTVLIQGEGQEIEVSEDSARTLTLRLCSLLNWGIRPLGEGVVNVSYLGQANQNSSREKPLGK